MVLAIKIPHATHKPGLAATPATGIQAIHVIAAATDSAGFPLAILRVEFKACFPPSNPAV
jgi:hypothetical protein